MSFTDTWTATFRAPRGVRLNAENAERVRKHLVGVLENCIPADPPVYDVGEDIEDLELTVTVNSVKKKNRRKRTRK